MDTATRREALCVAAKLAFASVTFTCGGKLAVDDSTSDASPEAGFDAADEAAAATCIASADAAFDAAGMTCCADMIASALDAGPVEPSDADRNCCAYLEEYAPFYATNLDGDTSMAQQCCFFVPSTTPFCNPWGPPTPPAMV